MKGLLALAAWTVGILIFATLWGGLMHCIKWGCA
jgi:hypothetical protein